MKDNRCVCCGAVIPEGRQICYSCSLGKFGAVLLATGLMLSMANPTVVKADNNPGTLMKDVNYDGVIDSRDATLVLGEYARISAGFEPTFTRTQRYIADSNYDGKIDAVDASHILSTYAINSSGKFVPYKTVKFGITVDGQPLNYQTFFLEAAESHIESVRADFSENAAFTVIADTTIYNGDNTVKVAYVIK